MYLRKFYYVAMFSGLKLNLTFTQFLSTDINVPEILLAVKRKTILKKNQIFVTTSKSFMFELNYHLGCHFNEYYFALYEHTAEFCLGLNYIYPAKFVPEITSHELLHCSLNIDHINKVPLSVLGLIIILVP